MIIKRPFTVKLAIMYIIDRFGTPLAENILNEVAVGECDINYFLLMQCLYELKNIAFIETTEYENQQCLRITEKGSQALSMFTAKLPFSVRSLLHEAALKAKEQQKRDREFNCDIVPINDMEYMVKVIYKEGKTNLLDINLYAGNKEQALKLCDRIWDNKQRLYTDIYKYITTL